MVKPAPEFITVSGLEEVRGILNVCSRIEQITGQIAFEGFSKRYEPGYYAIAQNALPDYPQFVARPLESTCPMLARYRRIMNLSRSIMLIKCNASVPYLEAKWRGIIIRGGQATKNTINAIASFMEACGAVYAGSAKTTGSIAFEVPEAKMNIVRCEIERMGFRCELFEIIV